MNSTNFNSAPTKPNFRKSISLNKMNVAIVTNGRLSSANPVRPAGGLGPLGQAGGTRPKGLWSRS